MPFFKANKVVNKLIKSFNSINARVLIDHKVFNSSQLFEFSLSLESVPPCNFMKKWKAPSCSRRHRTRHKKTPPHLFPRSLVLFFPIVLRQLCLHQLKALQKLSTRSCFMLLDEIASLIYSIDCVRLSKVNSWLYNSHVTYAYKNKQNECTWCLTLLTFSPKRTSVQDL